MRVAASLNDVDALLGERRKNGALLVVKMQLLSQNQLESVWKEILVRQSNFWVTGYRCRTRSLPLFRHASGLEVWDMPGIRGLKRRSVLGLF